MLSVRKGQVIPIDILLMENRSQCFTLVLLIERLDGNGNPLDNLAMNTFLFRTTSDLPEHPAKSSADLGVYDNAALPDFNPDSPIWKIIGDNPGAVK